MVLGVQIIGLGFGLFMMYLFFLHYKRKDITRLEFIGWLVIWISFLLVTIWPHSLDFLVGSLNFSRTLDFFIFLGIFFIVFMTLYLYLHMRRDSTKLEKLVRKLAMERAKIK